MKTRSFVAFFCTLLMAGSVLAQDVMVVKGRLFDGETQRPVSGVNVIVRGEKKGASTDSTGYFRLELSVGQKHILAFSHVAYRKETRELTPSAAKEVEFRIHLTPQPILLEEVVVHATRGVVLTKAAENRAIRRLEGEEFEKLGEDDMEKAMIYLLPDVVNRLDKRMASDANDFTLYVNGEWKESMLLSDIDPFTIRRVLVWAPLGTRNDIDLFPPGLALRRGRSVILVDTK